VFATPIDDMPEMLAPLPDAAPSTIPVNTAAMKLAPLILSIQLACAAGLQYKRPFQLPYKPAKASESCRPGSIDMGPNPDTPLLENLIVHLQVPVEQTCTNMYIGCAYDSKDYAFIAEAWGGLFATATDGPKFQDALTKGLADLATTKFGKKKMTMGEPRKCPSDFARDRSKYIAQLQSAYRAHFDAYHVSTSKVWKALVKTRFDGFTAITDQIGDDVRGDYSIRLANFVRKRI